MMNKLAPNGKRLYVRYFYNSVVEFIYFVILYLETYEATSVNNIHKYVKFFKTELADLISSFSGKASSDKLIQLLKTLDCFRISENEIKLARNIKCKEIIFEDFVISKCVDLLLRKESHVDTLCENVNLNSVVKINTQNLLQIIKKYSYISVSTDQIVTLRHFHGLMGFEDHICKTVIGYFHDILCHCNVLSYDDIKSHSKSLSVCGLNNMVEILCILYCSNQFSCQNGYICLSKKSKRYAKQKPIHVEKTETNLFSKSMYIGQIIYEMYGPFLHQWTGEIGIIKKNYGVIYCVVDFTSGFQGVFNIYFSKAALKIISELDNLEKYLNVRDVVKFDAEYYRGKLLDRCWKATKVKLCNNNLEYDENLADKLHHDTELERDKCSDYKYCRKIYSNFVSNPQSIKTKKCEEKHSVQKKLRTSDYESYSSNDSNNGLEVDSTDNLVSSSSHYVDVSNEHTLDYLFMFGHVYMLMEDKGIAIAKYGSKFYNVLFMKTSIYASDTFEFPLIKGQKILALVPYVKNSRKFDSVCVSIVVYCLNESETRETETRNISPKEFAIRTLFSQVNQVCNNCYDLICPFNNVSQQYQNLNLKGKIQLTKSYEFIKSQCKLPFTNDKVLVLLHNMRKVYPKQGNFELKVFELFVKLVKHLPGHAYQMKAKRKNKRKIMKLEQNKSRCNAKQKKFQENMNVKTFKREFSSETDVSNLLAKTFEEKVKSENGIDSIHLTVSPDSFKSSVTSIGSYKTCSTNCSEVFYSCESRSNSPIKISPAKTVPEIEVTEPLPTTFDEKEKDKILSVKHTKQKKKVHKKYINISNKNLSLQSVPMFKCPFKNRKSSSFCFKIANKKCAKYSPNLKGRVSLISDSFIFFSATMDNHDVLLPFPKNDIPTDLLETIKLNSSCEIVVIPHVLLGLSHILTCYIFK